MPTQDEIWFVRQCLGEASTESTFSDDLISRLISRHPLGTDVYDLNLATADGWEIKAAALADQISFSADGASFQLNQKHQQALNMARVYRSRRSSKSVTVTTGPFSTPIFVPGFPPEHEQFKESSE